MGDRNKFAPQSTKRGAGGWGRSVFCLVEEQFVAEHLYLFRDGNVFVGFVCSRNSDEDVCDAGECACACRGGGGLVGEVHYGWFVTVTGDVYNTASALFEEVDAVHDPFNLFGGGFFT